MSSSSSSSSSSFDDDDNSISSSVASSKMSVDDDFLNTELYNNDEVIAAMSNAAKAVAMAGEFISNKNIENRNKKKPQRGGSRPGRSPNKNRDFQLAYNRIILDYFSGEESVYDEKDFRRRFRISRSIFNKIRDTLFGHDVFVLKVDALGKEGIHPLVRLISCFRTLAYGDTFDRDDEYLRMSESSIDRSVTSFCNLMIKHFGPHYLNRAPTIEERDEILKVNKCRGFPGLMASWDCSHFDWKKCPMNLHGQYKSGRQKFKTIVLEAVVDCNLRMWYCNFGSAGSLNDINILQKSSIVGGLIDGSYSLKIPKYTINGVQRDYCYFLTDGIYPPWSIFISTYPYAVTDKEKKFSKQQEAVRKDVERVFAVLTYKFQILDRAFRLFKVKKISRILQTCVILHNMQIEERISIVGNEQYYRDITPENENDPDTSKVTILGSESSFFKSLSSNDADIIDTIARRVSHLHSTIKDVEEHHKLLHDLTEHIWKVKEQIYKYK